MFWVFDLDGTLSNCDHRIQYAQSREWDEFHARLMDDKPRRNVVRFFQSVNKADELTVVLTGRPERYMVNTLRWMKKHDIVPWKLLMRHNNDYRPDAEMKLAMLEGFCKSMGFKPPAKSIVAALEDRDKVVEAFRAVGIETWQVAQGGY